MDLKESVRTQEWQPFVFQMIYFPGQPLCKISFCVQSLILEPRVDLNTARTLTMCFIRILMVQGDRLKTVITYFVSNRKLESHNDALQQNRDASPHWDAF